MPAILAPRLAGLTVALSLCLALAACGDDSSLKVKVAAPASPSLALSPSPAAAGEGRGEGTLGQPSQLPARTVAASEHPLPNPLPSAGEGIKVQPRTSVLSGTRLQIPSIGVDAPVVTLGVNRDGTMQVPDNGTDVGWYNFSAAPGMPGNAVLSGHLDTATSPTAVFNRLKDLKQGDGLSIVDNGHKIDYSVFWTKAWPDDAAPLPLILGNAPSPTLTLITCAGTFDRARRNYSERLVVRAKLPGSV